MIRLKETDEPEEKQQNALKLKAAIEGLLGKVPELNAMEVGLNLSTKEASYDMVLTSEFDTPEALDAYRIHPEHEKVLALLMEVYCETAVVDYKL